ncbi:hypothetical protein [Vibrio phage RYC]|nr:hypothetical protein [Vibrio phage RYC]
MNIKEMQDAITQVTYKEGWSILFNTEDERPYIQVAVDESVGRCSVSGKPAAWKGGKKYLSFYMCSQEVVGACFAIIKEAEEHEMREYFRYKGASIFNPHLDPDVLAEVAKKKSSFVTRPDNQSMTQEEPKEVFYETK